MADEIEEEEITLTELISDGLELMKMLVYYNMIVTDALDNDRKEQVLQTLVDAGLHKFDLQREDYDFVVVENINSPRDIYLTYQKHNGKLIIFNTEKIFSRKEYLDVLEGGVCSSPDSSKKWQVHYGQEKALNFTGHAIILTSKSREELLEKKEKYKYLLRDLAIV